MKQLIRSTTTKATVVAMGVLFAMGGGVAAAFLVTHFQDPTPQLRQLDAVSQSAFAESAGVRLSVQSATYSGTETIVNLSTAITDASAIEGSPDPGAVTGIFPSRDAISGPFEGSLLAANAQPDGSTQVHLPRLSLGPAYDGTLELVIGAVIVQTPAGSVRVHGEWSLSLVGPDPDEVGEVLRVEALGPVVIEVGGMSFEVSGARSRTGTVVSIAVPQGAEIPAIPTLQANGERFAYARADREGGNLVLTYPPTPFGSATIVYLGDIAIGSGEEPLRLTVDLSSALDRSEVQANQFGERRFDIAADDVIAGDPDVIVGGRTGEHNAGSSWIGITVQGTWPRDGLAVFSADGDELVQALVVVGYSKDPAGNVGPGATTLTALVEDVERLRPLTFLFDTSVQVINGDHAVVLRSD